MRQATDGDEKTTHFYQENTGFETNKAQIMCPLEEGHEQWTTRILDVMLRLGSALPQPNVSDEGSRADAKVPCSHKTPMTSHFVVGLRLSSSLVAPRHDCKEATEWHCVVFPLKSDEYRSISWQAERFHTVRPWTTSKRTIGRDVTARSSRNIGVLYLAMPVHNMQTTGTGRVCSTTPLTPSAPPTLAHRTTSFSAGGALVTKRSA
ncbi:hypothetical protein EDB85DRAFT_1908643 [Lactarius pseudohatsudake]|nr:hypothetical protein EDB85DRAFT_1908643 [Lactarius pseudohatsudake]